MASPTVIDKKKFSSARKIAFITTTIGATAIAVIGAFFWEHGAMNVLTLYFMGWSQMLSLYFSKSRPQENDLHAASQPSKPEMQFRGQPTT